MTNQAKIGLLIKSIREKKGLTQTLLAERLKTSQSAVARMESGLQNFTSKEIEKISAALESKLISVDETMDFKITGNCKLSGEVNTNPSKNGALGLLCAALLNKSTTTLKGIPKIEEVNRLIEVLKSIGVKVSWTTNQTVVIVPPKQFDLSALNTKSASKIRSVLMLIGSLSHYVRKFIIPHAGGCKMGNRTIEAHRHGLSLLGISIKTTSIDYVVEVKKFKPTKVVMYEASDTATENVLMAAALIPGETIVEFASPNYQVQDVCFFLQHCGVKIEGVGTTTLKIYGVKEINKEIDYHNSEDPIESMMFLSAAITTSSHLKVKRCPIDFLQLELLKLKKMGLKYRLSQEYVSYNKQTKLVDVEVFPSKLKALTDKIHAQPYPGINTDNLPFFVPIATQAAGRTLIHDWMWENRAIYFTELNRLGASVALADPHRVFINGPTKLIATQIVCPPALRPAVIILIAMLRAEGVSILRNVYSIYRGYEEIAERLNKIGAKIEIIRNI